MLECFFDLEPQVDVLASNLAFTRPDLKEAEESDEVSMKIRNTIETRK